MGAKKKKKKLRRKIYMATYDAMKEIHSLMRWTNCLRQSSSLSIPSACPRDPQSVAYILKSSSVPKLEVTLRSSKELYIKPNANF